VLPKIPRCSTVSDLVVLLLLPLLLLLLLHFPAGAG
jgi:hypothetical protein